MKCCLIHPFFTLLILLGCGTPIVYPTKLGAQGRIYILDKIPVYHTHSYTRGNLEIPFRLQCMSLNWGRNTPKHREKLHTHTWERAMCIFLDMSADRCPHLVNVAVSKRSEKESHPSCSSISPILVPWLLDTEGCGIGKI